MFMRRRPLMAAAAIGGTAYVVGKHRQAGQQQEADQNAAIADLQAQQAPPAQAAAAGQEGIADQLAKLKSLLDSGVLTQDEFAAAKQKVLAGA
jgi:membrane protease subunit (stomatin/prohibitin family)